MRLFCALLLCASSGPCSILCASSIFLRIDAHHQFCLEKSFDLSIMKAYVMCASSVRLFCVPLLCASSVCLFCAPLLCTSSVPCSILRALSISRRIDAHHQFCLETSFDSSIMKAYVLCASSVHLFCAPLLCASSVPCSILRSSSISRRIDAHHQFCITAFFLI